jgi:hypothetical protein
MKVASVELGCPAMVDASAFAMGVSAFVVILAAGVGALVLM